jgi:hypothetical protein
MPTTFPIVPKFNWNTENTNPPNASALVPGEIATNITTGKIFLRKASGDLTEIAADKISSSALTTSATANGVPQLDGNGHIALAQLSGITTTQIADLTTSAVAGKIPQLDGSGKISAAQLPAVSVGALTYKGVWDVNTSPVIASGGVVGEGTAVKGDYYVVGAPGTTQTAIDGKTQFLAGDLLAFNGTTWDLIHGATSEVVSVNTKTPVNGNVTLTAADVSAVATSRLTLTADNDGVPKLTVLGQLSHYQIPPATETTFGGFKLGSNLSMTNGVLSAIPGTYTLPAATDTALGGVKVGASLSINESGVLNVASAGTY